MSIETLTSLAEQAGYSPMRIARDRTLHRLSLDESKFVLRHIRPGDAAYGTDAARVWPWLLLKRDGTEDAYGLGFSTFERAVDRLNKFPKRS